jgi:RluA family pseudouridine synthase
MAKPGFIDLGGSLVRILYEDRSVLALDKPSGWLVAPESWEHTSRNLHRALLASIQVGEFWARSRNLRYLRFVHRLDAETSGVLLCVKNPGAVPAYSRLFESRQVEKVYWAVVHGVPKPREWTSNLGLVPDPHRTGRMIAVATGMEESARPGGIKTRARKPNRPSPAAKPAETHFRVLQTRTDTALVEARPLTGRTHQIRVHLAAAGHAIMGDDLYGPERRALPTRLEASDQTKVHTGKQILANSEPSSPRYTLALRAVRLAYRDPFTRRRLQIAAPTEAFLAQFGFGSSGHAKGRSAGA